MTEITALVPMRHHSQRVPGKNFRPLAGKPLFHHIISTLLSCSDINNVVVDTDSQPIMDGLKEYFPQVCILERPEHLRGNQVSMNEVLLYDTSKVHSDLYLQTHSTSPLLSAKTIAHSIRSLLDRYPAYDSLFSVTRIQSRLWDQLGCAINHNPAVLLQTQDLPPVFEENSCLYIFSRETLLARRNRLGERPMMFEIDPSEAWDIDDELDFSICDYLLNHP
ncbi:cytidylyltransferase domain-containing protein [Chloroflexota bacterium]